jgi:hypothetical protein
MNVQKFCESSEEQFESPNSAFSKPLWSVFKSPIEYFQKRCNAYLNPQKNKSETEGELI